MTSSDQQAEFDRMHGYLTAQGERHSLPELWPRATRARLQLIDALDGVSDEQAAWSPTPEDWSIKEAALHALNSSRNVRRTLVGLVSNAAPDSFPDPSEIEPPRRTTDATLDALRHQIRQDAIDWAACIHQLPERPALTPTAPHSQFGDLHARAWYLFQRVHDIDHANQIDAVKQAPGYPASPDPASRGAP